MSTSEFVEKYFVPSEAAPKGLDESQIGITARVIDISEVEGQFRLSLEGGRKTMSVPHPQSVPRSDSFYFYEGRVYRVLFHLKPVKEFPTNIKIHLELCPEVKSALIPLKEEVTDDGLLALYVYTVYRVQVVKWYPLAEMLFEKEEVTVDELSGEGSYSISGEAEQEPEDTKSVPKPKRKQAAQSSVSQRV